MRVLTSASEIAQVFEQLLEGHARFSMAVAWASINFPGYDALIKHKSKILKAAIGIHFYQTHPDFIKKFLQDPRIRYIKSASGVFHPKFYLFETSKKSWACLVGSGNFTQGAFRTNDEAIVLTRDIDNPDGTVRNTLLRAIGRYWQEAAPFNGSELPAYRKIFEKNRNKFRFGSYGDKDKGLPIHKVSALTMSWSKFANSVQHDRYKSFERRAAVLREAKRLFNQFPSFNAMPLDVRKKISGFIIQDRNVEWGWFGTMRAAGT